MVQANGDISVFVPLNPEQQVAYRFSLAAYNSDNVRAQTADILVRTPVVCNSKLEIMSQDESVSKTFELVMSFSEVKNNKMLQKTKVFKDMVDALKLDEIKAQNGFCPV